DNALVGVRGVAIETKREGVGPVEILSPDLGERKFSPPEVLKDAGAGEVEEADEEGFADEEYSEDDDSEGDSVETCTEEEDEVALSEAHGNAVLSQSLSRTPVITVLDSDVASEIDDKETIGKDDGSGVEEEVDLGEEQGKPEGESSRSLERSLLEERFPVLGKNCCNSW
ncbi:hypothetical protein U1Q18_051469, partial [Sarracenia purpurea var. burkii]